MSDEERSIAGDVQGSLHGEQNDISNVDQMSLLNSSIDVALRSRATIFFNTLIPGFLNSSLRHCLLIILPLKEKATGYSSSLIPIDQLSSVRFCIV